MDWIFKLVVGLGCLYVAYVVVVEFVIPLVAFLAVAAALTALPTFLLGLILIRETPSTSWLNRNEAAVWIAMAVIAVLGLVTLASGSSSFAEALSKPSWVKAYAFGVYATAGLYVLYLSGHFVMRTWHYYRLPHLGKVHLDTSGRIDPAKVIRDAPSLRGAAKQTAWISHNQALRAAQALSGLTGGGSVARLGPSFLDPRRSKVTAARELVQAYTAYLRGATETYGRQHEDDHYQALKRQKL